VISVWVTSGEQKWVNFGERRGVGGLTMFEAPSVGLGDDQNFLTGNVGGGAKIYFGRWGVRGDYRYVAIDSRENAPAFFGRENRYGHRLYGGLFLGFGQ
jgi:hypothetical protein